MPEKDDKKEPVQPADKKGDKKVVPIADLLAQKSRVKKLEEELANTEKQLNAVSAELDVAKVNVEDDEEVKGVRKHLLAEAKKIETDRAKLDKDLTSFGEREQEVRATELANKYGVDKDAILAGDNMLETAVNLYAESLAEKEKKIVEEEPSESGVYESGKAEIIQKSPNDMTDEEFATFEEKIKREAASKAK